MTPTHLNRKYPVMIASAKFQGYCLLMFAAVYIFSVQVANICIFLACLSGIFTSSTNAKLKKIRTLNSPFSIAYFLTLCMGFFFSNDKGYALKVIDTSIWFLVVPLFLGTSRTIKRNVILNIGKVFCYSVFVGAVYCLLSNVYYFIINKIDFNRFFEWDYTYQHLTSFIGLHPTYFSIAILICFNIVVFVFPFESYRDKTHKITLLIFFPLFLIILGSKVAIVLFIVLGNVAVLIYVKKKLTKRLLIGYLVANLLIVAIMYKTPVVYWRFKRFFESSQNSLTGKDLSDYRIMHWKCAWESISKKPFMGWGTGDAIATMDHCYTFYGKEELHGYNAHNQYFESWLKTGIAGLITILLSILTPLVVSIRRKQCLFIFIFLIYALVAATESVLSVQKGIILFCVISSLYLDHICKLRPSTTAQERND